VRLYATCAVLNGIVPLQKNICAVSVDSCWHDFSVSNAALYALGESEMEAGCADVKIPQNVHVPTEDENSSCINFDCVYCFRCMAVVKSFSDENLAWCSQQCALNSVSSTSCDTDGETTAAATARRKPPPTSLRMRVARVWSSRDLLDRISSISSAVVRRSESSSRGDARAQKALSSFLEPVHEFDSSPTTPVAPATPSCDDDDRPAPGGATVADVLRQAVDFLVYEVRGQTNIFLTCEFFFDGETISSSISAFVKMFQKCKLFEIA